MVLLVQSFLCVISSDLSKVDERWLRVSTAAVIVIQQKTGSQARLDRFKEGKCRRAFTKKHTPNVVKWEVYERLLWTFPFEVMFWRGSRVVKLWCWWSWHKRSERVAAYNKSWNNVGFSVHLNKWCSDFSDHDYSRYGFFRTEIIAHNFFSSIWYLNQMNILHPWHNALSQITMQ